MKKSLAWLLLLGWVAGCTTSPPPDTATHYDAATGLRTDVMADNMLEAVGTPPRELVWLNASRMFRSSGEPEYYLEATYMATPEVGYLEILPGESLTLMVDEVKLSFRSSGSANLRKQTDQVVSERAIYPATKLQMQQIATATKVTLHLTGKKGLVQRDFNAGNIDKFKKFVTAYAL